MRGHSFLFFMNQFKLLFNHIFPFLQQSHNYGGTLSLDTFHPFNELANHYRGNKVWKGRMGIILFVLGFLSLSSDLLLFAR